MVSLSVLWYIVGVLRKSRHGDGIPPQPPSIVMVDDSWPEGGSLFNSSFLSAYTLTMH
jgi:hypothetical protein